MGVAAYNRPGAGAALVLAAFAADELTRAALEQSATEHWPGAVVADGGRDAAATYLASGPVPNILVVDLGDSETPLEDLLELAGACDPTTQVVALGCVNDLGLYKRFIAAGVADYLVKPVTADELQTVLLAASLQDTKPKELPASHGGITIVIGARGGVGASTLATNAAWMMAEERDLRVVLLDIDLQFGTAALSLDMVPVGGLVEALQHPDRLDSLFMASTLLNCSERLSILAAEEDIGRDPNFRQSGLERMLQELSTTFDWIRVDMPRTLCRTNTSVLNQAHDIIIVSDLSLAGMRDTLRIKAYCEQEAPTTALSVVLNRLDKNAGSPMTAAQFEKGVDASVAWRLPEDAKTAAAAAAAGKPLAMVNKRSKLVADLRRLSAAQGPQPEAPKQASSLFRKRRKAA